MVHPDRFELPTFWFVGMQRPPIFLIFMPGMASFEANAWRTKAAVDERLMKGFPERRFFKITPIRLLPTLVHRGCENQISIINPIRASLGQWLLIFSSEAGMPPRSSQVARLRLLFVDLSLIHI